MSVTFLTRPRKMGSKAVRGPVTGIEYVITPYGTPVSDLDVEDLLAMTEPPCCGEHPPFVEEVKSFGVHTPSSEQLENVPDYIRFAKPAIATGPVMVPEESSSSPTLDFPFFKFEEG